MLKMVFLSKHLAFTFLLLYASLPALADDSGSLNLNLDLNDIRILPPVLKSYSSNDYMSLYDDEAYRHFKSKRRYPLGLVRFKADKGMRVRGWEVTDNLYFGQAKVGKKWGVGFVWDRGDHYYGLNNQGFSYLKRF